MKRTWHPTSKPRKERRERKKGALWNFGSGLPRRLEGDVSFASRCENAEEAKSLRCAVSARLCAEDIVRCLLPRAAAGVMAQLMRPNHKTIPILNSENKLSYRIFCNRTNGYPLPVLSQWGLSDHHSTFPSLPPAA